MLRCSQNSLRTTTAVKAKKFPLVRVEWIDAESDPSWKDEEDILREPIGHPVVTVGFLVRKPSKSFPMYIVAGTMATREDAGPIFNTSIKIPKMWVKSIEELKDNKTDGTEQ
jgi:hypothetical protein